MCSGDEELEGGRGRGMIVGQAQERATDTLAGWLAGWRTGEQAGKANNNGFLRESWIDRSK